MIARSEHPFETSSGKTKLVVRDFITGAENWAIRNIYDRGLKEEKDVALEAERKGFEIVVVSVNGETTNIADQILALPLSEYQEIVKHLTPIFSGETDKKKSETSS